MSRFSDEQIIGTLKEHQARLSAADLWRKHGISDLMFYKWQSKFSGMEVSKTKRLKQLEHDKARLKKIPAMSMMDESTLWEMFGKTLRPNSRISAVIWSMTVKGYC
jgi:putative transposase